MALASQVRIGPMAALVAGGILLGLAPILVRVSEVGSNATGFWRLLIAAPLLGLLTWRTRQPLLPVAGTRLAFAVAGICFGLDLVFWHASINLTSVANATLFANLTPVVVIAIAWAFFDQKPSGLFLAGVGLALAGSLCLAGPNLAHSGAAGTRLTGDLLGVITSGWYAGYLLACARLRERIGAAAVTFGSTVIAMLVTAVAVAITGETFWPQTLTGWGYLVALAVLVHVAGQGGIVWALGQLPAALSSIVILIQPAIAAALAWIWFGEALHLLDYVGALLVIGGILVCRRAS